MESNNQPIQNQEEQPKKRATITTPAAIVTAGVLIALGLFLGRGGAPLAQKPTTQGANEVTAPAEKVSVRDTDPIRGNKDTAEIIIVEYSDSDCPFCERFHNTMKAILASNDNVAWAYRHFPLSIHPNAINEAIALTCVQELGGNDAFWNYLDSVIGITLSPEKSAAVLTTFAQDEGVSASAFATCITDPRIEARVQKESAEVQALGGRGTPYSIAINTKTNEQVVIPGAVPLEQVQQLIDGLLQ
jgi:protein-disulfide isomerase